MALFQHDAVPAIGNQAIVAGQMQTRLQDPDFRDVFPFGPDARFPDLPL